MRYLVDIQYTVSHTVWIEADTPEQAEVIATRNLDSYNLAGKYGSYDYTVTEDPATDSTTATHAEDA